MNFSDIKLINLIVILGLVSISSFGCKSASPTAQETQTPATPQASETFSIPQANQTPLPPQGNQTFATPQGNQTLPVPQGNQTLPVPQAYQAPLNNSQVYQTYPAPQGYQTPLPQQAYQAPSTQPTHQIPPVPKANQPRPNLPVNQAANNTIQGLKTLPDGDYFYGEFPDAISTGRKYLVFRKTGNLITGQEYIFQTDQSHCFTGTADINNIVNVKIAYREPSKDDGKWLFSERESIKTNELHRLGFEKAPDFAASNLQECIKVFTNET